MHTNLVRRLLLAALLVLGACATAGNAGDPTSAYEIEKLDIKPTLENLSVVQRALESAYPKQLREQGIRGTVEVRFIILPSGRTADPAVIGSSGVAELDRAAITVVQAMHFRPAVARGRRVRAQVTLPIIFQPRDPS